MARTEREQNEAKKHFEHKKAPFYFLNRPTTNFELNVKNVNIKMDPEIFCLTEVTELLLFNIEDTYFQWLSKGARDFYIMNNFKKCP